MTGDERAILEAVRAKGRITLAGNREYYAYLDGAGDGWIRTDGDPMSGEESVSTLDDARALDAIVRLVRDRLGVYDPEAEVEPARILAWLTTTPWC